MTTTQAALAATPNEADNAAKPTLVKPAPLELDERGCYIIRNQSEEYRVAKLLMESGAVNSSLKNVTHVMVAMQAAKSVGLNAYTALRQIAFINGSLTFFGDLELAVVRMSGELDFIEEFLFILDEDGKYVRKCFENSNLHLPAFGAVCRLKRKGMPVVEEAFTEADAKTAGLWGRGSVWSKFPGRMMQMRARGVAIKNCASDITQGVTSVEYEFEGLNRND